MTLRILLPILTICCLAFACKEEINPCELGELPTCPPASKEYEEIYIVVEDMPRFPGCEEEENKNKDEIKECAESRLVNFINDNLEYPIKLNDIASLLGISQFYFSHLFKKSTGIAPYKYVIQQRVAKAKNLIKDSNLSLIEIAYECGFSSQSQMTQHFRKYIGITPKVYQIRVEKNKCLN